MNQIAKPDIVNLLRVFDKNRWINPRIRYASIRSKPDLISDLRLYFQEEKRGQTVHFHHKRELLGVPQISYDLKEKRFLFDGESIQVQVRSREKPTFSIRKGPVMVYF